MKISSINVRVIYKLPVPVVVSIWLGWVVDISAPVAVIVVVVAAAVVSVSSDKRKQVNNWTEV